MMNETNSASSDPQKLLSTLGLCRKAGKAILGTSMICDALSNGKNLTEMSVFMASDVSDNTKKRLVNKCQFYSVPLFEISLDGFALAAALGKSGALAAVAVTDKNLSKSAEKYI